MNQPLLEVARRVNWYTDPTALLQNEPLFLCQVMQRAHADDVVLTQQHYPPEAFRAALLQAPPGLFDPRSWCYWTLMLLGECTLPLPQRFTDNTHFDWRKHIS